MKALCTCFILLISIITQAQSEEERLAAVTSFLNAQTAQDRALYMSDDFRFFFDEKIGEGEDKQTWLSDFSNWDEPLHPRVVINRYFPNKVLWETVKNTWTLYVVESNDLSKAIGFPGWDAKLQVTFTRRNKIKEILLMPSNKNEASYKTYLKPAVDWLTVHYPDELKKVYDNGKLVKTRESALKWMELLSLWRKKRF
jgi:hypothetical protein